MILELFAGLSFLGGLGAAWGWWTAASAREEALTALERRRAEGVTAANRTSALEGERNILSARLASAVLERDQAWANLDAARTTAGDSQRKLQELYATLRTAGVPGGADRVRALMQEAGDAGALPLPDPGPHSSR